MISAPKQSCDKVKLEAFANRFMADTAAAVRSGLNYIGDRLGIFKSMAALGPVTVESLAQETKLNKRYLQEWLAALTAAEYLEYDPIAKTYLLPPEHAALLAHEDHP